MNSLKTHLLHFTKQWSRRHSLAVTMIGMLLLSFYLINGALGGLDNADTFFHLAFGKRFADGTWKPWSVGHLGPEDKANWHPTQWLSQYLLAELNNLGGLRFLTWLQGFIYVALIVYLYRVGRRYASPLVVVILVGCMMEANLFWFSLRPQMASFFLFLMVADVWLRTSKKATGLPWWTIGIFWLWPQLHGMWSVGLALTFVLAAVTAWERGLRKNWTALLVPILSALATLATPVGPAVWSAGLAVGDRTKYFSEWGPPQYNDIHGYFSFLVLAFAVVALLWCKGKITLIETALVLIMLAMGLYSLRTMPLMTLIAFLLIVNRLSNLKITAQDLKISRNEMLGVGGMAALALAIMIPILPVYPIKGLDLPPWMITDTAHFPKGTVVLADAGPASYLMYERPDIVLPYHGYADVFTDEELRETDIVLRGAPGWEKYLKKTRATVVIISPYLTSLPDLLRDKGWKIVHNTYGLDEVKAPANWLTQDK